MRYGPFRVEALDRWTPIFNQLAAEYAERALQDYRPRVVMGIRLDVQPFTTTAQQVADEIGFAARRTTMRGTR